MFFRKPQPKPPVIIFDGQAIPLVCDPAVFHKGVSQIRDALVVWRYHEAQLANGLNVSMKDSLADSLANMNIKRVASSNFRQMFERALIDTKDSISTERFLDTVLFINQTVDHRMLTVGYGKFIQGVLHTVPGVVNNTPYPTEEEWKTFLARYPWIWMILIYQETLNVAKLPVEAQKILRLGMYGIDKPATKQVNTQVVDPTQHTKPV